jgi:hypothetical protein
MTKTEARNLLREIRAMTAEIQRSLNGDSGDVKEALNVIDGDSELLRRNLVEGD